MSEPLLSRHPPKVVAGLQIPGLFPTEKFLSALSYDPRDGDLFLVTYPKCGTTWTQQVLVLLFGDGVPPRSRLQLQASSPFLEVTGSKGADLMQRPGAIKMHLPFDKAPWSEKAKYIYVARNPKDVCVSYFHHEEAHGDTDTFDQFFEKFVAGKVNFGDYFDHLIGWHDRRHDPNVLFLTYEDMKVDPAASILKMASFIDEEQWALPLRRDPQKLENILKFSSFDYMKESFKFIDEKSEDSNGERARSEVSVEAKKFFSELEDNHKKSHERKPRLSNLIRKGVVGDWKNYFSDDQNRRMNEIFVERTKGTKIPSYWKNYM